ncbi:MAG TPA: hypothetical protein VNS22_27650 [Geminicoccus sp.]|uniref:hypothetical protein n=1 Tax=Geminicoccus sp. TaxID=2024832 RepID=UPI002B801952|nr:hypothetical protein [Geminicoccus sp.]HWL72135.1 hypothetical protein [Geminicoccus sp.]
MHGLAGAGSGLANGQKFDPGGADMPMPAKTRHEVFYGLKVGDRFSAGNGGAQLQVIGFHIDQLGETQVELSLSTSSGASSQSADVHTTTAYAIMTGLANGDLKRVVR